MSWSALLYQLAGYVSYRERRARRRAELAEKAKQFGVCGWCGEVLLDHIHDSDCPTEIEDERELFR